MIYPYTVKHNGVWYPAGAEVPTDDTHLSDVNTEGTAVKNEQPTVEIPAKKRGRRPKV